MKEGSASTTARLLADLGRPDAFPRPAAVEVRQTHASVVFLVGDEVWKVKKPIDLGFLDYSTLERRAHAAELEVSLNRRLAPDVYLGVEPVVERDGRLQVGGPGTPVDWAVHMRRLPDDACLKEQVLRGAVSPDDMVGIAQRIADFHAQAEHDEPAREAASFEVVAELVRTNLRALKKRQDALQDLPIDPLVTATELELARRGELIEARARRGLACAFHGDLRVDHVYRFPEREPPDDVIIVDGIEFSESLRRGDPIADLAFLVMDLAAYGAWTHADRLAAAHLAATGDDEGHALLPLYVSYRSAVRAMVAALLVDDPDVPAPDREAALERVRRHVLLALGELLPARVRPRLILTSGLPGSGKSTLARGLAQRLATDVLRTDVVRKELAGVPPNEAASAHPTLNLYTPRQTRRTYATILLRADASLRAGRSVIVDGNAREPRQREMFRDLARQRGVPFHVLRCEAPDAVLRGRLEARQHDASDADTSVLDLVREGYQPAEGSDVVVVDSTAHDAVGIALTGILGTRD